MSFALVLRLTGFARFFSQRDPPLTPTSASLPRKIIEHSPNFSKAGGFVLSYRWLASGVAFGRPVWRWFRLTILLVRVKCCFSTSRLTAVYFSERSEKITNETTAIPFLDPPSIIGFRKLKPRITGAKRPLLGGKKTHASPGMLRFNKIKRSLTGGNRKCSLSPPKVRGGIRITRGGKTLLPEKGRGALTLTPIFAI